MTEQTVTDPFATRYTETELWCPKCRGKWSPAVADFVNLGTDPKGREGMLRKTMHHSYCPACKYHFEIDHTFSVYDPEQNIVVQVRPTWELKAGGGEDYYLKRLEELVLKYAEHDVRVDVVFGFDELNEKYLGGEQAVAEAMKRADAEKAAGLRPGDLVDAEATDDTPPATA